MKILVKTFIFILTLPSLALAQTDLEKALTAGGKRLTAAEVRDLAIGKSWIGEGGGVIWHPSENQRKTITPKGEKFSSRWWVDEAGRYCLISQKTNSEYCSIIVAFDGNSFHSFIKDGYRDIKFSTELGNSRNIDD